MSETEPLVADALSTSPEAGTAQRELLEGLSAGLGGRAADLVLVFATHHYGDALERLGPALARRTGAEVVAGCTAESVIGGAQEVEGRAGMAALAASLPGTEVRPLEVGASAGPGGRVVFSGLPDVREPGRASLLLLADPFAFPMDRYLEALNDELGGVPALGGMASGAMEPGQSLLLTERGVSEAGAIGAVLEGDVELRPVVSQGCRPVGRPWVVTGGDEQLVRALGGRPALDALMETFRSLSPRDQELFQRAPMVGLAIDPTRESFERGDLLVRGILRISREEGWIAVGDHVRRGQTIHFLVRDAESAGEDLQRLLAAHAGPAPAGALLFSCNGRGTRMFEAPDHDAGCLRSTLSPRLPVAGFFAAGEIGPVGGRNFLHGFTASVAVLARRE